MPYFEFLCLTRDNAELRGTMIADDKHHVAQRLLDHGMSLQWCKEIDKKMVAGKAHRTFSLSRRQMKLTDEEIISESPSPEVAKENASSLRLLDWIINHSGGIH